jgi:hypothetical protein
MTSSDQSVGSHRSTSTGSACTSSSPMSRNRSTIQSIAQSSASYPGRRMPCATTSSIQPKIVASLGNAPASITPSWVAAESLTSSSPPSSAASPPASSSDEHPTPATSSVPVVAAPARNARRVAFSGICPPTILDRSSSSDASRSARQR